MASRKQKREALYKKLELLRDVTNSSASLNDDDASVIVDASDYIQELKQKVEKLNQDIGTSTVDPNPLPQVTVETLEKGFRINVFYSEKSSSGLLVLILEAFDDLGLEVVDANVTCSESFHLEAVAGDNAGDDQQSEGMDSDVVKQAVLQAITNWNSNTQQ